MQLILVVLLHEDLISFAAESFSCDLSLYLKFFPLVKIICSKLHAKNKVVFRSSLM